MRTVKQAAWPAAVVSLSLLAAGIHARVAPEHAEEWWGYGAFFVLAAVAEGGAAAAPRRRPRAPSGRTAARWALWIAIALLVVAALLFGSRWYLDRQWYVAPNEDKVAIFQGVPLTILGYDLGQPYETSNVSASAVRELGLYPTLDEGIAFATYDEADEQLTTMEREVEQARRDERRDEKQQDQGGGG